MKVICIDNTAPQHPDCVGKFMVKEGCVYTVYGGFESGTEYFYQLTEDEGRNGWNSIYFIPLSDIDENNIFYETKRLRQSLNRVTKNK